MRLSAPREWGLPHLSIVVGIVFVVAGFTVLRPPEQPFCTAEAVVDAGIPNGYGASRDPKNGCAWTIYAPDGSSAPASAYADMSMFSYPGPRPSRAETLAPVLMWPILGLGLIVGGAGGAWMMRRRERNDRGRPRVHES